MLTWKVNKEMFLLGFIWFLSTILFFGFWCAFAVKHGSLLSLPRQKQDLNGKAAALQGSQSPSGHLPSIWVGVMAWEGVFWEARRSLLCFCSDLVMGAFLWKHPSPFPSWAAVRLQPLLSVTHNMALCGKCKASVYELFTHYWSDI